MSVAAPAVADAPAQPEVVAYLWKPFAYFNYYRLTAASLFLAAVVFYPDGTGLYADRGLFLGAAAGWWFAALGFVLLQRRRKRFNRLLTLQMLVDILALTLLLHASGGHRSGLPIMLVISLAGAGLVGQGRLAMFYAAMATLAVLAEQGYRTFQGVAELGDLPSVGLLSIGFFATAISARLLAQRVIANETLARERGIALENQGRLSERIISDMQDGVVVVDPEGKVRQANPQARRLLERPLEAGQDLAQAAPMLAPSLSRLKTTSCEASVMLGQPAHTRSLRARLLQPVEGGAVLIYLEDMDRVYAQAQQIKLAALGRLTASIAHEIRNPLAAISHAAELLREEKRADMQTRLTRIIQDNSQRIDRMVRDILELGRRDRSEPEVMALDAFLDTFLDEFCAHEKAGREIFRIDAAAPAVLAFDRAHLNQVLWNLTGNALRHCSRNAGSVVVRAVASSAGRTELHIIDDGPGIPADLRGRVFEPFFTTHAQGTGLGLYIARELCEANGATLELRQGEKGAHFCITGKKAKSS